MKFSHHVLHFAIVTGWGDILFYSHTNKLGRYMSISACAALKVAPILQSFQSFFYSRMIDWEAAPSTTTVRVLCYVSAAGVWAYIQVRASQRCKVSASIVGHLLHWSGFCRGWFLLGCACVRSWEGKWGCLWGGQLAIGFDTVSMAFNQFCKLTENSFGM